MGAKYSSNDFALITYYFASKGNVGRRGAGWRWGGEEKITSSNVRDFELAGMKEVPVKKRRERTLKTPNGYKLLKSGEVIKKLLLRNYTRNAMPK